MFACEMLSGLFCCCGVFIEGKDGGKRERQSSLVLTDVLSGNRVSGKVLLGQLALQVLLPFFQEAQLFFAVQDIPAFFIKP